MVLDFFIAAQIIVSLLLAPSVYSTAEVIKTSPLQVSSERSCLQQLISVISVPDGVS